MDTYKRNQVEEAIAECLTGTALPSPELKTRMKRLLEIDRGMGRTSRSHSPEAAHFAFYDEEAPGRGGEVWFSPYCAFALLTALRLQGHNWPQSFPVRVLRHIRQDLERQHTRILKQDPEDLFDQQKIMAEAREGQLAFDNSDPVLLVIVSDSREQPSEPTAFAVCRGMASVGRFVREQKARMWTSMELATPAHVLANNLKRTEPLKRGRS